MNRIVTVVRIQLQSRTVLIWPWAILATAFAVNLLIFGTFLHDLAYRSTGGLASIYIIMLIIGSQCISQFFPYALGMSVSRRAFYLGTALLTLGMSVVFGAALYLISIAERLTGGWGIRLHFFRLGFMETGNPVTQLLVYVVPFLVVGFTGIFCGVVLRRWGMNGMFILMIASIVAFGGGATLITWRHGWGAIANWFTTSSASGLIAGWPSLVALAFALAGYAGIRRASA